MDREAGKQSRRYHRLRQLDLAGTQALFGPRTVRFKAVTTPAAVLLPNPCTGPELTLGVTAPTSGAPASCCSTRWAARHESGQR